MKRRLYILVIALVVLLVACCGWTVEGARWALRRPRLATA